MGSAPIARQIAKGDRRVLARALTQAENGSGDIDSLLAAIGHGTAHRVGITGAPGVGKSTLVSALTRAWRAKDKRVGILAVDPSSPFTGGALLGDRVRMVEHTGDEGVFIRSLATRGALGGLAPGVYDAADLLDAGGFDPVVIETVGVGQAELEICRAADTTVLVLAPGAGDEVQGMKAGLLEAADVLVINQADRDGAEALAKALEAALDLRQADRPRPPMLLTTATAAKGIGALCDLLDERGADADGALADRRVQRGEARLRATLLRRIEEICIRGRESELAAAAVRIASGESTAAIEAELLISDMDIEE